MTKHQSKFWFLFSSLLLLGLFFASSKTASASDIFNFLNATGTIWRNTATGGNASLFIKLGHPLSNGTFVSGNGIWFAHTSSTDTGSGGLYECIHGYTDATYGTSDGFEMCNTSYFHAGAGTYSNDMIKQPAIASGTTFDNGNTTHTFDTTHAYLLYVYKSGGVPANDFDITLDGTSGMTASDGSIPATGSGGWYSTDHPFFCLGESSTTDCVASSTPPSNSSPTIAFYFPVQGTTTGQFTNWTVQIGNVDTVPPYIYGVAYSATGTPDLANPNNDGVLQPNNNVIQFIPSSIVATPNSSTTYHAVAFIALPGVGVVATSTQISFTIDGNAPLVSNWYAHFVPPLSTSTAFCISPGNTLNIGEGIAFGVCSVAATIFGNNQPSYTFLANQWHAFQSVPPFSLVFGVQSSTIDALNAASGTAPMDLYFDAKIMGTQFHTPLLTSSTMINWFVSNDAGYVCDHVCAVAKTDVVHSYERYIIWATTGIGVVAVLL